MASEEALCLENIDEFVNDENKIVTCKWLSLTLKIHINQAKRLLFTFLEQQKKKKNKDVNATYFVSGLAKTENGHMEHQCLVVSEADLDGARRGLVTVTSCHVYSVQRACLKDSNSLYTTDNAGVRENWDSCNKYSSIHCESAGKLRSERSKKVASPEKTLPSASKVEEQKPQNGHQGADKSGSGEPHAASNKGKKGKPEPKGSIASMFAQGTKSKDTAKNTDTITKDKEAAKENKPNNKKGSVMDLFANAKPAAKPKAAEVAKEKEKEKEPPATTKESKPAGKKGKPSAQPSRSKKSRPQDDSDSDEQPDKKRRRRIKNNLFDSSSDEEEVVMEAESPPPSPVREPSPEPEDPPSPPHPAAHKTPEKKGQKKVASPAKEDNSTANSGGEKLRRRRRKLVPKTYLDEDGFMVTEKVWESESTDASEVEEETKKKAAAVPQKKTEPAPAKKASPQKKTSPAKGKQTSLMSFFKKK